MIGFNPASALTSMITGVPDATTIGENAIDVTPSNEQSFLEKIVDDVKKVLPTAVSTAQAAIAQLSYSGTTGNFITAEENIILTAKFYKIVEQYPEKIGCPYYQADYLNTFSGFVKCRDAVFSSTIATVTEESAIEEMLNGGFFFE